MLVSVVMTAHNTAAYVDASIASVLASTHRDLELVFVDDGSTDRTAEIARRWAVADSRVQVTCLERGRTARSASRRS